MAQDERSWSRALMASSGVALDHDDRVSGPSHEWLEAGAADLDRARLIRFASHRDTRIRETIALRPDCPTGVLATLAFDDDRSVRRAVAANRRIAQAIAAELARDRDQEVLRALARNPAVGEPVVRALASHRRGEVRRAARGELEQRAKARTGVPGGSQTDPDELIPPELRDRWMPPRAETSPAPASRATAYAPRPVVPSRPAQRTPDHPATAEAPGLHSPIGATGAPLGQSFLPLTNDPPRTDVRPQM